MAPQMLRLAGQRADGTILWMTGPATVRDYIVPAITAAARGRRAAGPAGRLPAPGLRHRRPCGRPGRAPTEIFAIYGQLPSYRAMLDREGAAGPATSPSPAPRTRSRPRSRRWPTPGVTDFVAVEFARGAETGAPAPC